MAQKYQKEVYIICVLQTFKECTQILTSVYGRAKIWTSNVQ